MAAVRGDKQLCVPFCRQLTDQLFHADVAEVIFRLLKQQHVQFTLLLPPAQRKLGFDKALPALALAPVPDRNALSRLASRQARTPDWTLN